MTERVVVIGAGGFGRETLDVLEASAEAGRDLEIVGVIDTGPSPDDLQRLQSRSVSYLGTEDAWLARAAGDESYIVAIGNTRIRAGVARRLSRSGLTMSTVVHPAAVVGTQTRIGHGVVIAAGVQVSTNVVLGNHVHLNPGSIIGHDTQIFDFVSVNPGAVVSGNVALEEGALIGAASVVLQGRTIGAYATVGAGACVTKDVPESLTVVGVPARVNQPTRSERG